MDYLSSILPELKSDEDGLFAPSPTYFAVGISPDGKVQTTPCPTTKDIEAACFRYSRMGWSSYFANAAYKDVGAGRKQLNVQSLKAFWLDVDVGKKGNSYATREEALDGIAAFVRETSVEPTHVVSSGMGFYVYYCLPEPIDPTTWRGMARALGKLCSDLGFVVDPACTADSARILRLPGTIHPKSGNTVEVLASFDPVPFETFAGMLRAHGWNGDRTSAPAAPLQKSSVFDAVPSYRAETIVANCRQMRMAGGGTEPSWYAMMSVLKRCVDGREWAHALSERDPRYVPEDTDRKFDRAPSDAPATCERFALHAPMWCEGCQWKGMVKSPAELYRRCGLTPSAEVEQPSEVEKCVEEAPAEPLDRLALRRSFRHEPIGLDTATFSVTKGGVIWHDVKKNAAGDYEKIDHVVTLARVYYLYSTFSQTSSRSYEWTHWFRSYGKDGKKLSPLTAFTKEDCASPAQVYAKFCDMFVFSTDLKAYGVNVFQRFYNTYMQTLVSNGQIRQIDNVMAFGWKEMEDGIAFSIGPGVVDGKGFHQQEYSGVAEKLSRSLGFAGTLEEWKKIPAMYEDLGQPEAMLAICMGFASALMPYAPGTAHSAIFSIWSSKSGLGKTQMLRAIATIWGDPDGQFIENSTSRTAIMRNLAVLRNLPAYLDELTEKPDDDLYSLAYALASGQEKKKLKRSGDDLVETGYWNNVTFCTANKSIKESVSHVAGDSVAAVARIIECECHWQSYADDPGKQSWIKDRIALCKRNYGLAGPEFIYQLLRREDRLDTLPDIVDHWVTKHMFSNEERFLSNPLALAIKAGRWCVEWGILNYDMDRLEKWTVETFGPMNRRTTAQFRTEAHEILYDYLMARQRNFLVVKTDTRQGRPPAPVLMDPYIVSAPVNTDILGRLALAEGRLYFSSTDFDSWCKRNRYSSVSVLSQLRDNGYDVYKKLRNLASGTQKYHLPQVTCVVLDSQDLAKLGFVWEPIEDKS